MTDIELDLSTHCVETAAKRLYNRLLSQYFRGKETDAKLEEKLEILQKALSSFDFPTLRADHIDLAGNSSAHVVLSGTGENLPLIVVDGRPVDPNKTIRK